MKTITKQFFCETEEKRSRFLATLVPYTDYATVLEDLRQVHPKANHHVSAFRYFDEEKRLHEGAKDDGEPSGSAGQPTLKVLQGYDVVNCAVIITRYFGGIKLGTGGMARAYAAAAKAVLEQADFIDFYHQKTVKLAASFARVSDLERLLAGVAVIQRHYTPTGIEIDISGDETKVDQVASEWIRLNY